MKMRASYAISAALFAVEPDLVESYYYDFYH